MNYVKLAHMAKATAHLTDESYRALLNGCGLSSSKDIKEPWQWNKVRKAFSVLGVKLPYAAQRQITPVEKKCYALWCKLYEQGKVRDKSFRALEAFRRSRFGNVDIMFPTQWTHFIEILKKWVERV